MCEEEETADGQDAKESAGEAVSRLDGKELCSDLNQWSLEGDVCLKVQVPCVRVTVDGDREGWGKGLDPHPSPCCLGDAQVVRFAPALREPSQGHLPGRMCFFLLL